jgi:hypothetical protein
MSDLHSAVAVTAGIYGSNGVPRERAPKAPVWPLTALSLHRDTEIMNV